MVEEGSSSDTSDSDGEDSAFSLVGRYGAEGDGGERRGGGEEEEEGMKECGRGAVATVGVCEVESGGDGDEFATSEKASTRAIESPRVETDESCSDEESTSSLPLAELPDLRLHNLSQRPHRDARPTATPSQDHTYSEHASASDYLHGNQSAVRQLVKQSVTKKRKSVQKRVRPEKEGKIASGGRKARSSARTAIRQTMSLGVW